MHSYIFLANLQKIVGAVCAVERYQDARFIALFCSCHILHTWSAINRTVRLDKAVIGLQYRKLVLIQIDAVGNFGADFAAGKRRLQ